VHLTALTAGRTRTRKPGPCVHLDPHLLCDHLHDPHHVRHLCLAGAVCTVNIAMAFAVPSLSIQLLVTVFFFGRDALSILLD
jgi:hypothetical protein